MSPFAFVVVLVALYVGQSILFAYGTRRIAERRGHDPVVWYWIGFFLGVVGIVWIALKSEGDDQGRPGAARRPDHQRHWPARRSGQRPTEVHSEGLWRALYRGDTHFDFVGNRRRWFTISAIIVVLSLGSLLFKGLNLGIDFEGGTLVEVENPAGATVSEVRNAISGLGLADASVQTTGGGSGIRVQTAQLSPEQEERLVEVVADVAGVDPTEANRQSVGPTFGDQVTDSAIRALVVFLIVVALFISWRLEWRMAGAGLVALGHDLVFTSGIYSLVGFEVTPATVVAILTILGYSLYDTVVVFDKVQENMKERGERHTISAIVNRSMNQVVMRSVNTSLTSLLPIGSLLFVGSFLLGAATLREFALALFIGIGTGTYSSIFLAAPLVAIWKEREEHWQRVRRRLDRKGVEDEFAVRGIVTDQEAYEEATETPTETGAVPRPPRKRKRRR